MIQQSKRVGMTSEGSIGRPVDLESVDGGGWKVVGETPSLLLDRSDLPMGWVRISFAYRRSTGGLLAPVLSFLAADGSLMRIRLDWAANGGVDHLVHLPDGVSDIALEFPGARGLFELGYIDLVAVGRFQAMARIVVRSWRRKRSAGDGRRLATLRRALSFLRRYGLKAFKRRMLSQYHSGAGTVSVAASGAPSYQDWLEVFDTLTDRDLERIGEMLDSMSAPPTISVIMPVYNTPERWLRSAIESVLGQLYPHWQLCIADDCSSAPHVGRVLDEYVTLDDRISVVRRASNGHISAASNSALELVTGDWVALLDHDDELRPTALFCVANQILEAPDVRFVYTDEDKVDEKGRRYDPHFKPDYNPELLLGQNYISHFSVIDHSLVDEVGGFREGFEGSQDYDLFLRCITRLDVTEIAHVPMVLYSWRSVPGSTAMSTGAKDYVERAAVKALTEHHATLGDLATVEVGPAPTTYRSRYALPSEPPLVSIVIPTRDGVGYVRQCIKSIYERTTYPRYEILLVDNDSFDPASLELFRWLEHEGLVRLIRRSGQFNYSSINNAGVRIADGDLVCLLNNDTEVITSDWLEEMVTLALQPGVGVVGAKLLYADRTVQHGGAILGIGGVAGHGHKHAPAGSHGYFSRLAVTHEVGAVTGACLVTHRDLWEELGGLDEQWLPVAFNDIDYCVRVRDAGHRILFTPHAVLFHHESKTRGMDDTSQKLERLANEADIVRARWGDDLLHDPSFNPNLSLDSETFELAQEPRYTPPWLTRRSAREHSAS